MKSERKIEYFSIDEEDPELKLSGIIKSSIIHDKTIPEEKEKYPLVHKIRILYKNISNHFLYKIAIGLILTLLSLSYYFSSLEGCHLEQAECLNTQSRSTAITIGYRVFYSSLYFLLLVIISLLKITYKHFLCFTTAFLLFLFYVYDTGADFAYHGAYNRVFFYLFLILKTVFVVFMYFIIYIFKKYFFRSLIVLILLIWLIYSKYSHFMENSCVNWNKGLKNSEIDNSYGSCTLNIPPGRCFLAIADNFFDLTALRGINCRRDRNLYEEKNLLKKYIPEDRNQSNAVRLGFPRTEKWDFFPDCILALFNKNIFKSMIDMDNSEEELKRDVEVYIDFAPTYPEVVINLKKNDTLIKEREALVYENKDKLPFKNVIQIYLDALSRNHFKRKLKKTYAWIENFYEKGNKDNKGNTENKENSEHTNIFSQNTDSINSNTNYSSYQFLKYHSLDYYTYANMIPGYFGTHKWEEYNTTYFLWNMKEKGFITGQSSNVCEREGWDLELAFEPYLNFTNFDHEFNAFYCDPNFSDPDQPYHIFKGSYSITRKCMYGKDSGEFQIDYAQQFFEAYKDQNKFYRMMFSDAHEGSMEVVKYLDDPIVGFLEFLEKNGHLENSVLMIMSDHGTSMPGPAFVTHSDDWFREVFLGALFYVIPKNHKSYENFNRNLKSNENTLVTSFDIHATFINFSDNDTITTKYGSSLIYNNIDDTSRTCDYYKMSPGYCICNMI